MRCVMRKKILLDITPLKLSVDFRRFWLGNGISTFGGYMTAYAVIYQIFSITQSSFAVGIAGLFIAVPSLLFVLIGGSIGDSYDRRKLVLYCTSGQIIVAFFYFLQSTLNINEVWILYCLLIMQSLLSAINAPAKQTFMPRLIPKEQVRAASTLNMVFMTLSGVLGPITAGIITTIWSVNICYLIDALSYFATFYSVYRLPAMLPVGITIKPSVSAIVEGLKFIVKNKLIKGAFLTDMSITILGTSTALFPSITTSYFNGNPTILGLFMAAPAIGGFFGSICSGLLSKVKNEGKAVLFLALTYAFSILCFGLSLESIIFLPLLFLILSGAADTLIVIFNKTIVITSTPDHYRSRVSSVEYLLGFGGPQLGDFRAGTLGSIFSPKIAITFGGVTSILAVSAISFLLPTYRKFTVTEETKEM